MAHRALSNTSPFTPGAAATGVQRKATGDGGASTFASSAALPMGAGCPLDRATRDVFEPRFGADFSRVRVHHDGAAQQQAAGLRAQAFTVGHDIAFANGHYAPDSETGHRLLAHELAHVVQQAHGAPPAIQRKEVATDAEIKSKKDWTTADREGNTQRWKDACLTNLNAPADHTQYVRIVERRDFYKWFYEFTAGLGFQTRWALAATMVANGAHQIADLDTDHSMANNFFDLAGIELQGIMREGNQVIFDNVMPKLKKLMDGGPLKGPAALAWDMQVLAEEQTLIQPLYQKMSPKTLAQLDTIARKKGAAGLGASIGDEDKVKQGAFNVAGTVPAFAGKDIASIGDRWQYGMGLGKQFTPGGTAFDPSKNPMPAVGPSYTSGGILAAFDVRAHLHELDAWLNPHRDIRKGPGSDVKPIIGALTSKEQQLVLADLSPDGFAYSIRFAHFPAVTEAMVRQALPSDAASAAAVAAFVARWKAEVTRLKSKFGSFDQMDMVPP